MQLTLNDQTIDAEAIQFIQGMVGDATAFVCVSGGKDSTVVVDLVQRSAFNALVRRLKEIKER